ncbi:MAG: hypothetical protein IBX67_03295 [Dehalococcoidia bacterium]|nr:hypothetical protein [Dehalococcoidia bacterium]
MRIGLGLLVVMVASALLVLPHSAVADSRVEFCGSSTEDYTVPDGTFVVRVWLKSVVPISEVVMCYLDQEGNAAEATMSLVEGDATDGWWEATVWPYVWIEEGFGWCERYVDTDSMTVRVFLPGEVVAFHRSIAAWHVRREITLAVGGTALPIVLGSAAMVAIASVKGMRIIQERRRRRRSPEGEARQ